MPLTKPGVQLTAKVDALTLEKDQLEARLLEEVTSALVAPLRPTDAPHAQSELNDELTGEVSDLTDDFMANSDKIEELEAKLK